MGEVAIDFDLWMHQSWIEFLRGRASEQSQHIKSLLVYAAIAAWCEFTLLELWNGAQGHVEKKVLEELEVEVQLYAVNEQVWAKAHLLARRSREKGDHGNVRRHCGCRLCRELRSGRGTLRQPFRQNSANREKIMTRHGINDIRLFYENDVRFLKQF